MKKLPEKKKFKKCFKFYNFWDFIFSYENKTVKKLRSGGTYAQISINLGTLNCFSDFFIAKIMKIQSLFRCNTYWCITSHNTSDWPPCLVFSVLPNFTSIDNSHSLISSPVCGLGRILDFILSKSVWILILFYPTCMLNFEDWLGHISTIMTCKNISWHSQGFYMIH